MKSIGYIFAAAITCLCGSQWAAESAFAAEKQAIRRLDDEYVRAFNSKDAAAAANTFSDGAVYKMEDGRIIEGKAAIHRELEEQFENAPDATLELKVYTISVKPGGANAIEHGVSIVRHNDIEEPSSYVAEFAKSSDGKWQVTSVVEHAQAKSTEHLEPLDWMIGDWVDDFEGDVSARTKVEWGLDRAFITRKFAVTTPGRRELKGIEYIGWDPERKEIHSSYFDSDGGFGRSRWRNDGKLWIQDTIGVTPDGQMASATNIYTPKEKDLFMWRSVNRFTGGERHEDVPPIAVRRNKEESADAPQAKP